MRQPASRSARSLLLGSGLTALLSGVAAPLAAEPWVRIDMTRQALEARLGPIGGIDYGHYQWLPARHLGGGIRSGIPEDLIHQVDEPFQLHLGGENFDPVDRPVARLLSRDAGETELPSRWWLVQFTGPSKRAWLDDLSQRSLRLTQYIHPYTYVVWGSDAGIEGLLDDSPAHVRAVSDFRSSYKMSPMALVSDATHQTRAYMALVSSDEVDRLRTRMGGGIGAAIRAITNVNNLLSIIYLSATGIRGPEIIELPGVYALQDVPQDAGARGEIQNQVNVGHVDDDGVAFPGYLRWLDGTGVDGAQVTVSVVDQTGFRTSHQSLVDNLAPCTGTGATTTSCSRGTGSSGHATHVAGAIAGTGASGIVDDGGFLRGLGVAPGARLVSQDFMPMLGNDHAGLIPDGMTTILHEAVLSGAQIANNSWGPASTPRGYDIATLQVDLAVRDADPSTAAADPLLAVWAIMNGRGDRSTGDCAPSSLGSPDEAKNLFAVGATYLIDDAGQQVPARMDDLAWVSGHGNACDGRRVPHIVAPGCNTDNPVNSGDTAYSHGGSGQPGFDPLRPGYCGTSMAAPNVAGAAALFIERHRRLHGQTPSPALIKAAFTAVARNLHGHSNANRAGDTQMGHRPDRFQGYGRLDVDAVLNPTTNVIHIDQTQLFGESGQRWQQTLSADDPTQPMHIMLAWTDAPGHGLGGATPAWVNDLDLSVRRGNSSYRGNVIGDDGWSTTGGAADGMNNLEGVFLSPAQHGGGDVEIAVLASNIASDALSPRSPHGSAPRQDFALVCYNCSSATGIADSAGDLAVRFADTGLQAAAGDTVSIDFKVINHSTAPVQPPTVRFDLPAGLHHVYTAPASSASWRCTGGGRSVLCRAGDAAPWTASGSFRLRIDAGTASGVLPLVAKVAARGNVDPFPGNDASTLDILIGARGDPLFTSGFEAR